MIIKNGLVFTENYTFQPLTIHIKKDKITALSPADAFVSAISAKAPSPVTYCEAAEEPVIDASGCYVIPGLTDIHFHGCDGYDFCDGTEKACETLARFSLSHGVTSICPAAMTLSLLSLEGICKTAASFHTSRQNTPRLDEADLIGIHMEGPFIHAAKKGAQNEAHIQYPRSSLVRQWLDASGGLVKLISLAPELPGALTCIEECKEYVAFSIAHTTADFAEAKAAMDAGALHVTHLYNAMPPFHHRDSGVIGAAFDTENCYVELICDGVHISAPVVRATFRLFPNRVILISDSMRATGKADGTYTLGGQDVTVKGKVATLSDGTIAGSVTPLFEGMRTAVSMGIPLEAAIASATINPCRSIGADDLYGSISPGKKAHLLLLDKETLEIKSIIKGDPQS